MVTILLSDLLATFCRYCRSNLIASWAYDILFLTLLFQIFAFPTKYTAWSRILNRIDFLTLIKSRTWGVAIDLFEPIFCGSKRTDTFFIYIFLIGVARLIADHMVWYFWLQLLNDSAWSWAKRKWTILMIFTTKPVLVGNVRWLASMKGRQDSWWKRLFYFGRIEHNLRKKRPIIWCHSIDYIWKIINLEILPNYILAKL